MTDDLFDRFLELSPDAMIVVGTNGKIAMVNRQTEKMFGYRRADLIGGPIEMLIPKGAKTRHRKHRTAYFDSPKTRPMGRNLDLKGVTRDGREFPVEISLGPLETQDGTLAVAAVRDVSEKRRAEAETLMTAKDEVIAAGEQLKNAIESIAELGRQLTPVRIMRARLCVEPAIAREAAMNASGEAIIRVKLAKDRAAVASNWADYETQDDLFHRSIVEASDNILLLALFDQLNQVRRAVAWGSVVRISERPPREHTSFVEHDRIAAAIEARDPAAAQQAMHQHIRSVSARLFEEV